ncbi:general secretory pathway E domain protein [Escherichia coli]|nr:general secretory pathway E domain protein [Escherichia coli]
MKSAIPKPQKSPSRLHLPDTCPFHAAYQHSVGAITRLQDMGVEPFLLSSSLTA